jgi:YgiT-type zinc finger domain-containing protein
MKRTCNFCGNKNFREKLVQYIYKHDGHFLIVNNVPCEECEYCGERYFKAEALKKRFFRFFNGARLYPSP